MLKSILTILLTIFVFVRLTAYVTSVLCSYMVRLTYKCVSKQTIIGSDNGLSPDWRQAIIWTNDGLLLIGPLGTHFGEILIAILTFSFKKMCLKMASAKWRPFCLSLNVLMLGIFISNADIGSRSQFRMNLFISLAKGVKATWSTSCVSLGAPSSNECIELLRC